MKQTSETSFEPDWLALREPADHAARDNSLLAQAAQGVADGMAVLDLGSGTGSTARAFAHAGHTNIAWRFFDNDPTLLQLAQARHPEADYVVGDLADIDALPLDGVGLITASALFDIMPEDWVNALMARARAAGIPIYAALNYDGVMHWTPADARDTVVTDAFNRHQRMDKGLGIALGPTATAACTRLAATHGFALHTASSTWSLGPSAAALQDALVAGIADAAYEAGAADALAWGQDRRAAAATSHATIGHTDLLAVPK